MLIKFKSLIPAIQIKALSLLVAAILLTPPVFAQGIEPYVRLAECPGNAKADASLVNKGKRIVIALQATQRSNARAAAVIQQIPSNLVLGDFDKYETEIDFDFDGAPPHDFNTKLLISYHLENGNNNTRDLIFDTDTFFDTRIPLRRNSDGSYSARLSSRPFIEEGKRLLGANIDADTEVTYIGVVYEPFFPNKRNIPRIFVRNITFLGDDLNVNTKVGVGGCELIPRTSR